MSKHSPVCQPQDRDSWIDYLNTWALFQTFETQKNHTFVMPKLHKATTTNKKTQEVSFETHGILGDFWQLQELRMPTSYAMRRYPRSYIAHPSDKAADGERLFFSSQRSQDSASKLMKMQGILGIYWVSNNDQTSHQMNTVYVMNPKISFLLWVEWYCWCPKFCNSWGW